MTLPSVSGPTAAPAGGSSPRSTRATLNGRSPTPRAGATATSTSGATTRRPAGPARGRPPRSSGRLPGRPGCSSSGVLPTMGAREQSGASRAARRCAARSPRRRPGPRPGPPGGSSWRGRRCRGCRPRRRRRSGERWRGPVATAANPRSRPAAIVPPTIMRRARNERSENLKDAGSDGVTALPPSRVEARAPRGALSEQPEGAATDLGSGVRSSGSSTRSGRR